MTAKTSSMIILCFIVVRILIVKLILRPWENVDSKLKETPELKL